VSWHVVRQIDSRIHRIEEGGYVAFFVVQGDQRTAIIDTGLGLIDPMPLLSPLVQSDPLIINTHVHPDHSNGNRWMNAPTTMGRIEWEEHGKKWNSNTHRIPDGGWCPSQMVLDTSYGQDLPEAFDPVKYDRLVAEGIPEPTDLYDDGDVIDLGGVRLEVIHTPAHTRGHICLLEPETGWLIAGDCLAKGPPVWLHLKCRAEPDQMVATYQRLIDASDRFSGLLPAHGEAEVDPAFLRAFAEGVQQAQSGQVSGREVNVVGSPGIRFELDGFGMILAPDAVRTHGD
jgi:glyoxylase-like metal-dependent hydrolase (beta-lactamase superfamily II)